MFRHVVMHLGMVGSVAPVYIVGTGRCGTTLLRLILNRHRDLAFMGESDALSRLLRYGPLRIRRSLERFCRDWTASFRERSPYPDIMQSGELRNRLVQAANYAEAVDAVGSHFAWLEGKTRWGEKSPMDIQRLGRIVAAFPDARIVQLTRDPRAQVYSFVHHVRRGALTSANIYNTAKYWARCERLAAAFRARHPRTILQVRYEDLVASPEKTVREICGFAGLDFEASMLDTADTAARYAQRDADGRLNAAHRGLLRNINASSLTTWKQELSPQAVELVEAAAWKWLLHRDYTPVSDRPPRLGVLRLLRLELGWCFDCCKLGAVKYLRQAYWLARLAVEYLASLAAGGSRRAAPRRLEEAPSRTGK